MQRINKILFNSTSFSKFKLPESGAGPLQITGLTGSLRAVFLAYLSEVLNYRVIYLSAKEDEAEQIRDDLEIIVGRGKTAFHPTVEITPYEDRDPNPSLVRLRLETMQNLLDIDNGIIVGTIRGILSKLPPPESFVENHHDIGVGQKYEFEQMVRGLTEAGYERTETVEDVGHFTVRGGIIDIYPWTSEDPVRIEFYGNSVESIRSFNVVTQRSINEIRHVIIPPYQQQEVRTGIVDYITGPTVFVLEDIALLSDSAETYQSEIISAYERQKSQNVFPPPPEERYLSWDEFYTGILKFPLLRFDLVKEPDMPEYRFESAAPPTFAGQINRLFGYIKKNTDPETTIFIQCDTNTQRERFEEILQDEGLDGIVHLTLGAFHSGFVFFEENLHVLTDHEIFDRFKRRQTYKRFKNGEYLRSLNALNLNDYVVHIDYGIGQYKGLETIDSGGARRECIRVEYAEGDILYVSVDRLNRVQKYATEEEVQPKLTKLRSGEWERAKIRTRESIEKIAAELIELNAARKLNKGHGFSQDTHWQLELEASFPYEETEDQMRSIQEVKQDLEKDAPMDRLLCGDVGYGKTEVALRAAFKVVMDGKQAALLVPTTILAHQHFQTFRERTSTYPVNVEMLSRFRSAKEQKQIIEKLGRGEIDIIIGTHRLLSEDVNFKDLGLLIIDEEQRFGVKHKEKLKRLRVTVDVLTMSATPIPRTLHMSIMGARDLSHIETPPRNRLPVITEIHEWDDEIIRRVVLREIDRGGQVYFVHNRVQTIQAIRQMLGEIVPEARIAVAHGQLPEKQLENIMLQFVHKEFDILISTMIIENGLDIPNVNTIVIDRADKFGLAQLYQLRGRVGRSNEQAYAYLLVPGVTRLTSLAQKRLRAIQDFTDLGSGFKVALRDMEIRGIGNILGKEQSGNIQTVGFDLYCRLLEDSVKQLKAQTEGIQAVIREDRYTDPKLDVDFDLLIPKDYIYSEIERMTVYHRMVNFRSLEELEQMKFELDDRFGPVPASVVQLIDAIELKILAGRLYAARLILNKNILKIDFAGDAKDDDYFFATILPSFLNQKQAKVKFIGEEEKLGVQFMLPGKSKEEQISFAKGILKSVN